MRLIKIPASVTVHKFTMNQVTGMLDEGEEEVLLVEFLKRACAGHQQFAQGPENGRKYAKIMDILEASELESEFVRLKEDLWKTLCDVVKGARWNTTKVNLAFVRGGFYDAVENAEDIDLPGEKKGEKGNGKPRPRLVDLEGISKE